MIAYPINNIRQSGQIPYSPNLFVRIGFIILTSIVITAFQLLIKDKIDDSAISIFTGISCILCLEYIVQKKLHYRSGIDDALLHSGIILIVAGVDRFFDNRHYHQLIALTLMILYALAFLRYLDRLAIIGFLASATYFLMETYSLTIGKPDQLLCCIIALTMLTIAFLANRVKKNQAAALYQPGLHLLETLALVACYGSLHYYTIDHVLKNSFSSSASAIHPLLRLFYWGWTVIIPILFLWWALRTSDKLRIRVSITLVLSIFYFQHYYYPLFSNELAAVLYGSLLILCTWVIIRFLQKSEGPFNFNKEEEESNNDIEPWLVAAGFAGTGMPPEQQQHTAGTRFGGGSFGGGGAGSEF